HVAPIRETDADDEARAGGELEGTVFLAAPTPRSLAYARELATRGLRPERVMVLGGEGEDARALLDVCAKEDWEVEVIAAGDVNDPAVVARLAELRPRMVVYSGFGGQIVAPETLATAEGFLHSHSGWLPHERGSTTLYYGLLRDGRCAVSVFLLAPEIDAGGILARRRYAAPTAGADVDREYDAAIRADLLGRVLSVYAASRRLPPPLAAESSAAPMHYVIHPVLKHLAQLRLGSGAPPCPEKSHVLHS
ncbi:MAG TPA: hypothetical protein VFI96_03610, partial [Longimicrobiaceae bacterium]|nr:hypothetical protein [Longimicrobiaceae bacterium]